MRSISWVGGNILVGTKDSDIYEISVGERDKPRLLLQVCYEPTSVVMVSKLVILLLGTL